MHDHPEEMFADFREYYDIRLSDVLRFDGSLPVWEAVVLAKQLPPTSRTMACLQGGIEYWGWTLDRHVMVSMLEAMRIQNFAFISAHTEKKIQAPTPIARPGDEERRRMEAQNNPFAQIVKQKLAQL